MKTGGALIKKLKKDDWLAAASVSSREIFLAKRGRAAEEQKESVKNPFSAVVLLSLWTHLLKRSEENISPRPSK